MSPLVSAAGLNPAQFSLLCFLSPSGGSAYISRPKLKKKKRTRRELSFLASQRQQLVGRAEMEGLAQTFFFKEN